MTVLCEHKLPSVVCSKCNPMLASLNEHAVETTTGHFNADELQLLFDLCDVEIQSNPARSDFDAVLNLQNKLIAMRDQLGE